MAAAHSWQRSGYGRRHREGIHSQRPSNSKKIQKVHDYELGEIMISPDIVFGDFSFVVAGEKVNDTNSLQGNR